MAIRFINDGLLVEGQKGAYPTQNITTQMPENMSE